MPINMTIHHKLNAHEHTYTHTHTYVVHLFNEIYIGTYLHKTCLHRLTVYYKNNNNNVDNNSTIIRPPQYRPQLPSSPLQPLLPNNKRPPLKPRLRVHRRRMPLMLLPSPLPLRSLWVQLAVVWRRAVVLIMHSILIIIITIHSWRWARNVPPRTMTCYNWYLFFLFFFFYILCYFVVCFVLI